MEHDLITHLKNQFLKNRKNFGSFYTSKTKPFLMQNSHLWKDIIWAWRSEMNLSSRKKASKIQIRYVCLQRSSWTHTNIVLERGKSWRSTFVVFLGLYCNTNTIWLFGWKISALPVSLAAKLIQFCKINLSRIYKKVFSYYKNI